MYSTCVLISRFADNLQKLLLIHRVRARVRRRYITGYSVAGRNDTGFVEAVRIFPLSGTDIVSPILIIVVYCGSSGIIWTMSALSKTI